MVIEQHWPLSGCARPSSQAEPGQARAQKLCSVLWSSIIPEVYAMSRPKLDQPRWLTTTVQVSFRVSKWSTQEQSRRRHTPKSDQLLNALRHDDCGVAAGIETMKIIRKYFPTSWGDSWVSRSSIDFGSIINTKSFCLSDWEQSWICQKLKSSKWNHSYVYNNKEVTKFNRFFTAGCWLIFAPSSILNEIFILFDLYETLSSGFLHTSLIWSIWCFEFSDFLEVNHFFSWMVLIITYNDAEDTK